MRCEGGRPRRGLGLAMLVSCLAGVRAITPHWQRSDRPALDSAAEGLQQRQDGAAGERRQAESHVSRSPAGCDVPQDCQKTLGVDGPAASCSGATAVVHAGFAKTGTSYIQSTLSRNRELLRSQSVLYPTSGTGSGGGFGHHFLPRYVANESNFQPGSRCRTDYSDGRLVQYLVTEVACAPCSVRVLISSEDLSNLSPLSMDMLGSVLQPRRVHVVIFYRNMKDFIVSMYSQHLRNSLIGSIGSSAYDPKVFGRTGSLKEYLAIHNQKANKRDRFGKLGSWMMNQIGRYVDKYNATIIDYAGAVKRGDAADALLTAAGLPTLQISQHPERAGVRDSAPTSLGDETVRQLFPYVVEYARASRNATLLSGKVYELDFNTLPIAKYDRPTVEIGINDLLPEAHALDEQLRVAFEWHIHPEFSDQPATRKAINAGLSKFVDLDHTAIQASLDVWKPRFDELLDALPPGWELRPLRENDAVDLSMRTAPVAEGVVFESPFS